VRLPDEIVERLRTVFARENLIAHTPNLIRSVARENRNQKFGRIFFFIERWTLDVGRWTFSPSQ
jgi:hypothetical protein